VRFFIVADLLFVEVGIRGNFNFVYKTGVCRRGYGVFADGYGLTAGFCAQFMDYRNIAHTIMRFMFDSALTLKYLNASGGIRYAQTLKTSNNCIRHACAKG
jgi:hypothetical protein